jgi:hypothetical protein
MKRATQLAPRGGAWQQPLARGTAASTAAKRLQALYRPVQEAKV